MKKIIYLTIFFVVSTTFFSCEKEETVLPQDEVVKQSADNSGSVNPLGEKTLRMSLIKEWGTGTHMVMHINGVKAEAEKYGIQLDVIDANNNLTAMADGIENAITNKMDAILLSHGKADALQPSVQRALEQDIPVIVFDNDFIVPPSLAKGKLSSIDQYDLMMGLLSQMSLVEELNGSGNVIYNRVANVPPTDKRHRIWEGAILPTYTSIKVLNTIDLGTDNPMPKAQEALTTLLDTSQKNIDAVYAVWDEYAKGFYNAIVASGKNIPLYSVDISDQDLAMMQEHPQVWRSSAAVNPFVVGKIQIRLALKALMGESIPRYYSLQPVLVRTDDLPSKDERRVTMADLGEFYPLWNQNTDFIEDWMSQLEKP